MQVILLLLLPLASQARARSGPVTLGLGETCGTKKNGISENATCAGDLRLVLAYV